MKKFGPYLIFFAAMLWATDAPFRVALLKDLPAGMIVLLEHLVDVLVVLPLVYFYRAEFQKFKTRDWLAVGFIAVCGSALASVAFTQAFVYANPSVVILLQKLQPIIAISLAAWLLQEKLGSRFWLWSVLGIFGAYLISFSGLRPQLYPGEAWNPQALGVGLALVAVVFWGASTVLGRYALKDVDFKLVTALRFMLAFVFLLVMNSRELNLAAVLHISVKDWLFVGIIALASGIFSLFLYYKGLQYTKASVATVAELGFPLAAVLVNYVFLHATLNSVQLAGMAILLLAVMQLAKHNFQTQVEMSLAKD